MNLPGYCAVQVMGVWFVTEQLCLSGVGAEVQPVPSERAAAESQQKPAGSWSDAALQLPAEPTLPPGGSEVRRHSLIT